MSFLVSQWCPAQHTLLALFLDHKIAAFIPLWKDGSDERRIPQSVGVRICVGNMRRPDRDEKTKAKFVVHVGVPELDLQQS